MTYANWKRFYRWIALACALWLTGLAVYIPAAYAAEYQCRYAWVLVNNVWYKVIVSCVVVPPISGACGGCHADSSPE